MRLVIILISIHLFLILDISAQTKGQTAMKLYESAQQQFRVGNLEEASGLIRESLILQPTAKSYYLQGLIYEAGERDLRALASYEAVLKLNPDYSEVVFQKGLIYLEYGDPSQALKDFTRLIDEGETKETRGIYFQVDPLGKSQHQVLSMVTLTASLHHYRGQAQEKLGNFQEALVDYDLAIEKDTDPDFLVSRALLYNKVDSLDQAIRDLRLAVQIDSGHQLAWYNLTLLDTTAVLPDRLLDNAEFAPTLGLLASRAMEAENYSQARKYFNEALKKTEDPLTYINRGRLMLKMEAYESARKDFNRARQLEPMRIEALYLIGNSFFYQKDYANANAYYDQYLTADSMNGMVWLNGAMSLLEQKKLEQACHYLHRAEILGMAQAKSLTERYCQ